MLGIKIAGPCESVARPTVYVTDTDNVVVQGYRPATDDTPANMPAGENAVVLPRSVILEAAAKLTAQN
jgi:hypothetical protein